MSLYKTIWLGWIVGVSAIFIPVFILGGFTADPTLFKDGPNPFIFAFVIPIDAIFQGAIFGGIILLGLKLLPKKYNGNT